MPGILAHRGAIYANILARNGRSAWYIFILNANEQNEENFTEMLRRELPFEEWPSVWLTAPLAEERKATNKKAALLKTYNRVMNRNAAPNKRKVYARVPANKPTPTTKVTRKCKGCRRELVVEKFEIESGNGVEFACHFCSALIPPGSLPLSPNCYRME